MLPQEFLDRQATTLSLWYVPAFCTQSTPDTDVYGSKILQQNVQILTKIFLTTFGHQRKCLIFYWEKNLTFCLSKCGEIGTYCYQTICGRHTTNAPSTLHVASSQRAPGKPRDTLLILWPPICGNSSPGVREKSFGRRKKMETCFRAFPNGKMSTRDYKTIQPSSARPCAHV